MTFLRISLLALLCAGNSLAAQTNVSYSFPVDYISNFTDVHVDESGLGYLGGTCGVLRKTTDNGGSWSAYESPTADDIEALACSPGGCEKVLLATDDRLFRLTGDNWVDVTYAGYDNGGELHWLTNAIVIHETGGDGLWRSTDGGQNWTRVTYGGNQQSELVFTDARIGYVFTDEKLRKTTDGGATFTANGYIHPARVDYLAWLNENDGWLRDGDNLFHRTKDGGASWTLLNAEQQLSSLLWFTPLTEDRLVAAQGITLAESNDGGVTWTRGQYGVRNVKRVSDKYHRGDNAFFLPGGENQLLYSGNNFSDFIDPSEYERYSGFESIAFSSNEVGYALAANNLLVTTDAGASWTNKNIGTVGREVATLPNGRLVVLWDRETGVSDDRGDNFRDLFAPGVVPDDGEYPDQLILKPNGEVYLMARNYSYISTDGGETFAATRHDLDLFTNALFFLDNDNGYALGRNRKYAYTTDGGLSWTEGGRYPGFSPTDIHFTTTQKGWATSANRRYVTTDRGATWEDADDRVGGYGYVDRPTDGTIIGARLLVSDSRSAVVRSSDGGRTWSELTNHCFVPRAGALTPNGKYYFVAGEGFIVRHDLEELVSGTRRRDLTAAVALTAFPNPAGEAVSLIVPASAAPATLYVYDGSGRRLRAQSIGRSASSVRVSLSGLPRGVYLLRWVAEDGRWGRVRVVKGR